MKYIRCSIGSGVLSVSCSKVHLFCVWKTRFTKGFLTHFPLKVILQLFFVLSFYAHVRRATCMNFLFLSATFLLALFKWRVCVCVCVCDTLTGLISILGRFLAAAISAFYHKTKKKNPTIKNFVRCVPFSELVYSSLRILFRHIYFFCFRSLQYGVHNEFFGPTHTAILFSRKKINK